MINRQTNRAALGLCSFVLRHCARRRYADMYERRPSDARGRSISLSSLRGHRVAATPLRDTHVVVVAAAALVGRTVVAGGGNRVSGVWQAKKRLSHGPPSSYGYWEARSPLLHRDPGWLVDTAAGGERSLIGRDDAVGRRCLPTADRCCARKDLAYCLLPKRCTTPLWLRGIVVGQSVCVGGEATSQWSPGSRAAQTRCVPRVPSQYNTQR